MGQRTKRLNFGGDPDHRMDTGIVFRIRHYWEIRKVVNGRKSAAHTDSPDGGTGMTCLGGVMHCPSDVKHVMSIALNCAPPTPKWCPDERLRSAATLRHRQPSSYPQTVCRPNVCRPTGLSPERPHTVPEWATCREHAVMIFSDTRAWPSVRGYARLIPRLYCWRRNGEFR